MFIHEYINNRVTSEYENYCSNVKQKINVEKKEMIPVYATSWRAIMTFKLISIFFMVANKIKAIFKTLIRRSSIYLIHAGNITCSF